MNDIKNGLAHLKDHQTYPATKMELVEACNKLSDFSKEDKQWFMENLPDGTYESADEVIMALGWKKQMAEMEKDQRSSITM